MVPDISINELIKEGKKEEAAKIALDALRQTLNNAMPHIYLDKNEWAAILPQIISGAQSAVPEVDPVQPEEDSDEEGEPEAESETESEGAAGSAG